MSYPRCSFLPVRSIAQWLCPSALAFLCFTSSAATPALKFEVSLKPGLATNALAGRLLLFLSATNNHEPRFALDHAESGRPAIFGLDAKNFTPDRALTIDDTATASLNAKLSSLPAGRYFAQAVLDITTDIRLLNAEGNLVSEVRELRINAQTKSPVSLELSHRLVDEPAKETDLVKFVKIPSRLLSDFHHRPMFLRAGIILPRTYASEPERRFPLWIHIGGFGARSTRVAMMMEPRSEFRSDWMATNAPQMIYVLPDGAGPNGDPYQVNSANNGPYGDAFVQELIPAIEKQFRAIGQPRGRVLSGKSTGGWAALALQIFYPDFFNGAWSVSPDGVDFRGFELVDIYHDANAYVNHHGEERPSERELNGDVRQTMRREVQTENVLGHGGQWTRGGGQWGAWNAVYGPRGADGHPVPLWDAEGKINQAVAEQWQKYDLRLVLEKNWTALAPKLRGKLHIWVGDADDYFLNNAVHLLDESLSTREPKDVATFVYGPGEGHGWMNLKISELMQQLHAVTETNR